MKYHSKAGYIVPIQISETIEQHRIGVKIKTGCLVIALKKGKTIRFHNKARYTKANCKELEEKKLSKKAAQHLISKLKKNRLAKFYQEVVI